jgi:hypothetical protein
VSELFSNCATDIFNWNLENVPKNGIHDFKYSRFIIIITVNSRDCSDVPVGSASGVYRIYPNNSDVIDVYCNMDIDDGG